MTVRKKSNQVPEQVNIRDILAERGSNYGKFIDHADITQQLKTVCKQHAAEQDVGLSASQKEAIDMICHKLGRILNGNPNYADSWRDIAGYATLVADELDGTIT